MAICYFYVLSLLFLLFMTHWTNAASLRLSSDRRYPSSIINNETTTREPVLLRRRPILSSSERRRRGSKDDLLLDETIIEEVTSSTVTVDNQTTVLIHKSDEIYSTSHSHENSTDIRYPLLRQDVKEMNQTDGISTVSENEEFLQNNETDLTSATKIFSTTVLNEIIDMNSTESETSLAQVTDTTQVTSNETIEFGANTFDNFTTINTISNETETTSIPVLFNQTIEETSNMSQTELVTNQTSAMNISDLDVTIIFGDLTTILSTITDDNQTSIDFESNSTIISESISTMITSEDEYSNETINLVTETIVKPICDLPCQCSRECPYGYEILNDTCQCDPPCKNYQCFGNDTCTVTNAGLPVCKPENGTEHDRPSRCYQPRDPGYQDTDLLYYDRWYYHPDQDTCRLFVYRGLGGNENNFPTLHECHVECITCAPPPDPGTCLGRLRMWYYDYKQNQCSEFDYSGCKGNENKFFQKQQCLDTCITRILNL